MIFYVSTDGLRKGKGAAVTVTDTLSFEGTEQEVAEAKRLIVGFLAPPLEKWYVPMEFAGTVLFPLDLEHWYRLVANRSNWFSADSLMTLEETLALRDETQAYDHDDGADGSEGNWGLWQEAWLTIPEDLRVELAAYIEPIEVQQLLGEFLNASG